MADDFADLVNTPVIRLKWWGSYLENFNDPGVSRFLIAFESDIPAVGKPGEAKIIKTEAKLSPQAGQICLGGVILLPGVIQLAQVSLGVSCSHYDRAQGFNGFAFALLAGATEIAQPAA